MFVNNEYLQIIKNNNIDVVMHEHRISEIYEIAINEKTN